MVILHRFYIMQLSIKMRMVILSEFLDLKGNISQLKRTENKLQNAINKLETSNKELKEFAYVATDEMNQNLL